MRMGERKDYSMGEEVSGGAEGEGVKLCRRPCWILSDVQQL